LPSALSLLITVHSFSLRRSLENDSARLEKFKSELISIQEDLRTLGLPEILPDTLKEKKVAEAAAIGVLASMLDLIGKQLAYSQTFGRKFGKSHFREPPNRCCTGRALADLFSEIKKSYEDADTQLKKDLELLDKSLRGAQIVMTGGMSLVLSTLLQSLI